MKKIILLMFVCSLAFSQQKEVCFTVDDMPVVAYGVADTNYQKELLNNLISSFKRNNIPAIGFVNEIQLSRPVSSGNMKKDFLEKWLDNNLELGNHTYSHFDYNESTFEKYSNDLVKGENVLKEVLSKRNKELKYFRHPFLHVGNSKLKADSLSEFLSQRGYTVAPVTIDNEEYLFALCYHRANVKRDTILMRQIGHDYVDYIEKKLKYYEKMSINLFNRNIRQILLIHSNLLNSKYIDSLAAMFKRNDYKFISLSAALSDTVYQTPVTKYGNYGISWLDRWALSMGKKGEFFKDDPVTPEYIIKMSK